MTKDQKKQDDILTSNESTLSSNNKSVALTFSMSFPQYILIFVLSSIFLLACFSGVWYFWGHQYIEQQLKNSTVTKDSGYVTDIKQLKDNLNIIKQELNDLKSKIITTELYHQNYIELQKNIENLQLQIDQKKVNALDNTFSDSWKITLINTIKTGASLDIFRKNSEMPEAIKKKIGGMDSIPTYKNISKEWSKMRDWIKFESYDEKSSPISEDWWSKFKLFLKRIFRIQRLDANYLTPEELFIRQVDKLLVEREIEGLIEWIKIYSPRFDVSTKETIFAWVTKLKKFRKGQLILDMVKKY
jgi:hypothetical protein